MRVLRHRNHIALFVVFLTGCSTPSEAPNELEFSLQRLDAVSGRLAEIQVAMALILRRHTIVLEAPVTLTTNDTLRPSEVLDRLLQCWCALKTTQPCSCNFTQLL